MRVASAPPLLPPSPGSEKNTVGLGLLIGTPGRDISQADMLSYSEPSSLFLEALLSRFLAPAVDVIARDAQDTAKSKVLPWAAPEGMGAFTPNG